MNENSLTPEERKAIIRLVVWLAAKVGIMLAIQAGARYYLRKMEEEHTVMQPNILKDGKLHAASFNPQTSKFEYEDQS